MCCTVNPDKCWGMFLKELHNTAFPPSLHTSPVSTKSNHLCYVKTLTFKLLE
ncbi:hypothetical protein DPMN_177881 [Dreissena polymorpha]|uniref:Uncharacterized protein n=1 Tax=Dreissena polymorpha TaxID=45954 RepID=A0A9D4ED15_DREPO|nr:hypothetical protein DPMN_177881 [Dreissena polymorpha]